MLGKFIGKVKEEKYLILILFIGFAARLLWIGVIPGNRAIFTDEAFSGYEAFSLVNYGTDSQGYINPVYLVTWGVGMNAMQTWLIMPWVALFGLNTVTLRLPQAILGCITLVAFYKTALIFRGKKFAYIATFLLAVMPWHVMMSRWALESNNLPAFLALGMMFLAMGTQNRKYLPLAALCYGLSLYCYATIWPVLPVLLIASIAYLLAEHMIRIDRWLVGSVIIVIVLAIPLVLLVLVNNGYLPEYRGRFISIPMLSHFRSEELASSFKDLLRRLYNTSHMLITQNDNRSLNAIPFFGLFYKCSNYFIVFGIGSALYTLIKDRRKYPLEILMWIQFACGVILGLFIDAVVNRMNLIMIPLIYFCAIGVHESIEKLGPKWKYSVIALYFGSFVLFMSYYVTDYDDQEAKMLADGKQYALPFAQELQNENSTIYILGDNVSYVDILFYLQYPTDEYIRTVEYDPDNGRNLIPLRFGNYDYTYVATVKQSPIPELSEDDICILASSDQELINYYRDKGMQMSFFDNVIVGYY